MGGFGTATKWMVAGVAVSRCAMTINSAPNTHILKVSEMGDLYRKRICPYLRLMGLWLIRAGIYPNSHVCIENPQPGVLVIRLVVETVR
jgi:hypothetical protein